MKRLFALALALLMLLLLAACGKQPNDVKTESSQQPATVPVDSGSETQANLPDESETATTAITGLEGNSDNEPGLLTPS